MKRLLRQPLLSVLLITLLGAALRLHHLGAKSLWIDEAVIYLNAQGSLSDILEKNACENSAPATFTLLVRAVMLLGNSPFWLRLPSCLAGIVSIPLAYACFRKFTGRSGALLGCLLAATAPTQVLYAQQVREYSIAVLLTLGLLYWFADCMRRQDRRSFLWFSLTAAAAVLFQYGMVFVIGGLLLSLIVRLARTDKKRLGVLAVCLLPVAAAVGVVYVTALRYQFQQGGLRSRWRRSCCRCIPTGQSAR